MGSTNPADQISGSSLNLTILGLNSGTSMVSENNENIEVRCDLIAHIMYYIFSGWY